MNNKIFIYPTDTVWGIGGDVTCAETFEKIASIKKTVNTKPLSLLFSSVDQLSECFDITHIDLDMIALLKDLGVTIGIPKSNLKFPLAQKAYEGSDYVCVRVLENDYIAQICEDVGGPISTTSLNLTGEPVIVDEEEAHLFWRKHAPDALFVSGDLGVKLSGKSSTILFVSGREYRIIREGDAVLKINKILKELGYSEGRL
jgi:L-threonylcarbamoyladenylate synthase